MTAADEVGIGDVAQKARVERGFVLVVDAHRPAAVRHYGDRIGTGAQSGEISPDGGEEGGDVLHSLQSEEARRTTALGREP